MEKLRICYLILGTKPYYKEVSSIEEGKLLLDTVAEFVNAKVCEGIFSDHSSLMDIQEYDEDTKEWVSCDIEDF